MTCTAFDEHERIAAGEVAAVVDAASTHLRARPDARILIFDDRTGELVDVDLHGTPEQVGAQVAYYVRLSGSSDEPRGPGRPKLGVVAREVTLLPRHWEWLALQPGGASVTLRKLVDAARAVTVSHGRERRAREAAYRFLTAVAGDLPGFEAASRALFGGDGAAFDLATRDWPSDVKVYASRLFTEGGEGI